MAIARRAVLIDKDGTLIEDVPFNVDPKRIALMPGARRGLRTLWKAGYEIVVVSNQSGVARGYFAESALKSVETRLRELLLGCGVKMAGFYYCPHHHEGVVPEYTRRCACRKPLPGLLMRAARELELDLESSWIIGDILHDVEAGNRAGCGTILLDNGHETEWELSPRRIPHLVAADLTEAATFITSVGPLVHRWETMGTEIRREITAMGGGA